jgi:hypothetical protein
VFRFLAGYASGPELSVRGRSPEQAAHASVTVAFHLGPDRREAPRMLHPDRAQVVRLQTQRLEDGRRNLAQIDRDACPSA